MNRESSKGALAETLPDLVKARAHDRPDSVALVEPGYKPLTYAGLADQLDAMTRALARAGVRPGERVALVARNGAMAASATLGIAGRAACVPVNPQLHPHEVDALLVRQSIRAVVVDGSGGEGVLDAARQRRIPIVSIRPSESGESGASAPMEGQADTEIQNERPHPDDNAVVLTTSGTTADPKAVPYTHRNLLAFARDIALRLELTPEDRCLNVMPLFHSHGLFVALLGSLAAGGSVVCTRGLFFAPEFYRWLRDERPTWYTAVPTVHQTILAKAAAHREVIARSSLRLIRSASASLSSAVATELESTFRVPVIETYGLTEIIGWIAHTPLPPRGRKPGSVGVAGCHEIRIAAPDGKPLPRGRIGELVIRGRDRVVPYEKDGAPEPVPLVDGWFRTGDQGYVDDEGYYFITGRTKELINRGGEKISPTEIEQVLKSHPSIVEAVAFPIPTPGIGEEVGCVVVLREESSMTEEAVRQLAATSLAPFKVPKKVVVAAEIPKGPTGKYQRLSLATQLGVAP